MSSRTRNERRRRCKVSVNRDLQKAFQDSSGKFGIFPADNELSKQTSYASSEDDGKSRNDLFIRWGRRVYNEFRFQWPLYYKIRFSMLALIVLYGVADMTKCVRCTERLFPLYTTALATFQSPSVASIVAFFNNDSDGKRQVSVNGECWNGEPQNGLERDHPLHGSLVEADVVVTFNGLYYDPDAVTLMAVGDINEITVKSNNYLFHGFEVRVISALHGHFRLLLGETATAESTASACYSTNSATLSDVNHGIYKDETSVLLVIDSGHGDIAIEISLLIDDPFAEDGTDQAWYSTYFGNNIVFDEVDEETDRLLQLYNNSTFNSTEEPSDNVTLYPTSAPSDSPPNDDSNISLGAIIGSVLAAGIVIGAMAAGVFCLIQRKRRDAAGTGSEPSSTPVMAPGVQPQRVDTVIASLLNPDTDPAGADGRAGGNFQRVKDPYRPAAAPNPLSTRPIPPASPLASSSSSERLPPLPNYKDQTRSVAVVPTAVAGRSNDRLSASNKVPASFTDRRNDEPVLVTAQAVFEDEQQASASSSKRKALDP